jgi:zinc protease
MGATRPPPPPSLSLSCSAAARSAAAALLAAAHLAAASALGAATAATTATLELLPSASPSDSIVARLPPPPPAPRPLPSASAALAAAPPLLGPATLPNGLRLFMIEDHEAPLVRGTLLLKGGSRAVPDAQLGLGAITASSQRSGGSVSHPSPLLDSALADLAADIEVQAGPLAFSFDFGCLSSDAQQVLPLVAELAREPLFPDDRVAASRAQVVAALAHSDDDAGSVARRRLLELLYGPASVFARHPTAETAGSVTSEDVRAFARRWQRPDAAVLGVVGDFDPRAMRALVEEAFGEWRPAEGEPASPPGMPTSRAPELPPVAVEEVMEDKRLIRSNNNNNTGQEQQQQPKEQQQQRSRRRQRVLLIDRPGLAQASVVAGEPGVGIADSDAPALDVLSTALNSFGGALFDAVRSRDALAYSVSGAWDTPSDHRGLFVAAADTSRPAELLPELQRALDAAAGRRSGDDAAATRTADAATSTTASTTAATSLAPPSEESVARAREQALEQFAFSLGGSPSRLARALSYDALGLPQDFALRYRDRLAEVDRKGVLAAARRWLHPREQVVVVAADARVVAPELEAAGYDVVVEAVGAR